MEYRPISLEVWKETIARKKSKSAVGLDGVSRLDLQALPDTLHAGILQLLHKAEQTGKWPSQALNGAIHSLAKRENSELVGDYRPVTILPLIYRCWGTIRAREILAHLETIAPPSMLGHMPHRSAPDLWYNLQSMIEQNLYDGAACNGLVTDLIKAFNCLPREPLFVAAIQVGIPAEIVRAWAAAVVGIRRFFWVRNQPSEGVRSGTGYPEGCALSVGAMCLCNLVIHSFMALRCPRVLMFSYVDNLELVSDDTSAAIDGLRTLQKFTAFLGVPCDETKTYAWALDTQGRQQLMEADLPVHMQQKDLGAHVQYCGRQTNGAVKRKCKDLQTLWSSLAQSPAPLRHKYKILTAVAWPRALHAASTVHLAEAILTDLRAGAMKGLRLDKSGASPGLQFGLSPITVQDPGFFVLWNALLQFRKFADVSVAGSTLALASWTPNRLKKPGPCGVLAARLTSIGWTHVHNFWFQDQDHGLIDIMHCPIQELRFRCKRAWHHKTGMEHESRKGFQGLSRVDVSTSARPVPGWSSDEEGLLRVLHNGTFITHDQLHTAKQAVGHPDDHVFHTIASGGVPGQWQTILRAEIRAVIEAVRVAGRCHSWGRIWCDNATVVRRFRRLQKGFWKISAVTPDHDLWKLLAVEIQLHPQVSIHEVHSHQQPPEDDEFLSWLFAGNDRADWAACDAMSLLPAEVLSAQKIAAEDTVQLQNLQQVLYAHMVRVGMFAVTYAQPAEESLSPGDHSGKDPIDDDTEINMSRVCAEAVHAPVPMQFRQFHKVRAWLSHIQAGPEVAPAWITWYELFWSFQKFTGLRSVVKLDCHSRWDVQPTHTEYDTVRECRSFVSYMHHLIRVAYPGFRMGHVAKRPRPDGEAPRLGDPSHMRNSLSISKSSEGSHTAEISASPSPTVEVKRISSGALAEVDWSRGQGSVASVEAWKKAMETLTHLQGSWQLVYGPENVSPWLERFMICGTSDVDRPLEMIQAAHPTLGGGILLLDKEDMLHRFGKTGQHLMFQRHDTTNLTSLVQQMNEDSDPQWFAQRAVSGEIGSMQDGVGMANVHAELSLVLNMQRSTSRRCRSMDGTTWRPGENQHQGRRKISEVCHVELRRWRWQM
eukprot:s31_g28.t1